MPIIVNGEVISETLIREERDRVSRDLRWASISDPAERNRRIQDAAGFSAVNRMVFEQAVAEPGFRVVARARLRTIDSL
jgi:hypothetical protein